MPIGVFRRGLCPLLLLCMIFLLVGTISYAEEKETTPRVTREELRHEIMRFAGRSAERVALTPLERSGILLIMLLFGDGIKARYGRFSGRDARVGYSDGPDHRFLLTDNYT
jgi:hypothetical protein